MKKILLSVLLTMLLVSVSSAQEAGFARIAAGELIYMGNALHSCRIITLLPNPCNPSCANNEVEFRDAVLTVRNIDPNNSIRVKVTLHHFDPADPAGGLKEWVYPDKELAPYQSYVWTTNDFGWQSWNITPVCGPPPLPNCNCPPIKQCLIPNFSLPSYEKEQGYFLVEWYSVSGKIIIAPAVGGMLRWLDSTGIRDSYGHRPIVIHQKFR